MQLNRFHWAVCITLVTFSPAALAYLDPGTGSMIISAIIGLLASLALAIKTYWYRLIGFMRRSFGRSNPQDAPAENRDDQNPSSD